MGSDYVTSEDSLMKEELMIGRLITIRITSEMSLTNRVACKYEPLLPLIRSCGISSWDLARPSE